MRIHPTKAPPPIKAHLVKLGDTYLDIGQIQAAHFDRENKDGLLATVLVAGTRMSLAGKEAAMLDSLLLQTQPVMEQRPLPTSN